MDDTDLAARLAADLDGSFELLLVAHLDTCHAVALRITGSRTDAEEVAQDVFVRAHRALSTYDPERIRALRLRPWLATIAANLARNRRRRVSDRVPALSLSVVGGRSGAAPDTASASGLERADVLGMAPSAEAIVGERLESEHMARLLAGLPDRYRVPLVLRYIADLSFLEMADALGRPEGTLKAQVHRGLALLRAAHDAAERAEAIA
jgi:RNA polymerase sigma-70 factor (ECF subfamily)